MDYKGPIEAVLSTDLRSEPYNFSLWDLYTGTQLIVFKGNKNSPIPRCLQLIDNNHFISVNDNVLQVWSIFSRKCQDQKLFLPKRPSSICISPCANYLVAGISEAIYIWQLRSGNLLAHTQRHYQTVSVLKMNQEGTFLISGGEDGIVLVWPFADLISNTHNTGSLNVKPNSRTIGLNEPKFTWQHHSGPVTDLHITNGGLCITVSTDMTANLYTFVDGKRLYNVILPSPLWSVVMDKNETKAFMGGQDGIIYELHVSSMGSTPTNAPTSDLDSISDNRSKPMFTGHSGKIVNLIISIDGSRLVSASHDSSCKVWNVKQRKLLQDIKHQAPLANLQSLLIPDGLALSSLVQAKTAPPLFLKALKRNLYKPPREATITDQDMFEEGSTTLVHIKNKSDHFRVDEIVCNVTKTSSIELGQNKPMDIDELRKLKTKIKELYLLSAKKVFQDAANECLKPYEKLFDQNIIENGTSEVKEKSTKKRSSKPLANGVDKPCKRKKITRRTITVDDDLN